MQSLTSTETPATVLVGMSQIEIVSNGESARAVLGSCIGLVLYHPLRRIGAMAHIVLPDGKDRSGPPGKFADSAYPEMMRLLGQHGVGRVGLVAKLAGGASMFGGGGPLQIGEANYSAVKAILQSAQVPITGEHARGGKGRRITLDSSTGQVQVEIAGNPPVVL
ncbi:chemotaxis protein CheD [Lignipirellula cremea]|uniref:Probable chemoreceptor glutamine deamidase CheD n=1 Tax=Lignipirellula cremea TaxID=2528010 RepID=A0A518DUB7_9BACT|nr:chemotaxis protein CheD [Lignipirellula cremea]QDU95427.1 Chemoreceptor glutamine deamidase CheD [Lignipirellula cremea]